MVSKLDEYRTFVESLKAFSDEQLTSPIAEEKWSIRDIISHIMAWDENFTATILVKIVTGEAVVLEEHSDVQSFNSHAVELGKLVPPQELLDRAVHSRTRLIFTLTRVPESRYEVAVSDRNDYTLSKFLDQMFVSHDTHHRHQIETHLSK